MAFIQSLVTSVLRIVFRLVLIGMGLLFAAAVIAFLLALAGLWMLRALWAKLTGQQVNPWVMRVNPRDAFSRFAQRPGFAAQPEPPRSVGDITDVEIKERH